MKTKLSMESFQPFADQSAPDWSMITDNQQFLSPSIEFSTPTWGTENAPQLGLPTPGTVPSISVPWVFVSNSETVASQAQGSTVSVPLDNFGTAESK